MQVGVPDLIHLQFRPRWRDHHVIIISVIPGIDLPRRAHRLQIDGETAPQVPRRGQLQINFLVKQGLREWFMVPVRQARICLAMLLPDRVQARPVIKCGCQSRERYHVRSIRWQLRFLHLGKKIRRISQIQGERDVLRQVPRRVGPYMLVIVLTHHVAGFESIVRIVRRPVDLATNLFPNRVRNVQLLVISASVHRRQYREKRLAGIERYLGAVLRQTHEWQQRQHQRNDRMSQPETQANLQPGGKLWERQRHSLRGSGRRVKPKETLIKSRRKLPQGLKPPNSGCEPDGLKAVPFKAHLIGVSLSKTEAPRLREVPSGGESVTKLRSSIPAGELDSSS